MDVYAVLLCTAIAAVYSQTTEKLGEQGPCMSECPGTGQLAFQKGRKYTYNYSTVTGTFLQGTSHERSLLTLECIVNIEVLGNCHMLLKIQHAQLRANVTSRNGSWKEFDHLRDILEKQPLQFSYHDGKIQKICATREESTWALNVKRGILSSLQGNLKAPTTGRTIEEVDILGKCPTTYELRGQYVWKKKYLNQCTNRMLGSISLRSVALPGKVQMLDSFLECMQMFKDGILAETTCNEFHLVTLFSRGGNGAKTQTQSVLKLLKVEDDNFPNKEMFGSIYVTNLIYEKEPSAINLKGEEAAETVRNLCLASNLNFETTDLFMNLVYELRLLSSDALSDLWQRSSFKCRDNWQPLLDALPSCGTEACVGLMKDILLSKELEDEKVESFLLSLAFIPEPTSGMIASLTPLLQDLGAVQVTYLAITALVHHFCLSTKNCHEVAEVKVVMEMLQGHLGENCSVHDQEEIQQMLLVLKAIGNAGMAADPLIPTLSHCALLKSNADTIRLAAIEAFRRISCSANRNTLHQLYQTMEEKEEIRIAAYYNAMKCANQELLNSVRWTLQNERSTQVGSFVWSHLSQLLESDDPLKQDIADSLPDDILSKDFEGESWKYSTYSDATVHSESLSANMEASLIFTPSSFIPRSAMANLTIHTLGRAVNVLEQGIRLENAEDLLKSMLGHHSPTLSDILDVKDAQYKHSTVPPIETVTTAHDVKATSKAFNPGKQLDRNFDQQKAKKSKHSCLSGKYNKLNELQEEFTQGKSNKKELACSLSTKIFGNELIFLDCEGVREVLKQYSLSLAGITVKLLKGQEVQYNRKLSLTADSIIFPVISGIPIQLSLNSSASTSIKMRGNMDFRQRGHFFISGYIKPSALFQLSAQMGITGAVGNIGLKWVTGVKTASSLDGGIQMKQGQDLKVFFNTPGESMELFDFSSQLYLVTPDGLEKLKSPTGQHERKSCMNEELSKLLGWQPCLEVSFPEAGTLPFPLSGPAKSLFLLRKKDKGLRQYLLEASFSHISQEDGWLPNEANLHFFMGTPKSEYKRDVGIDLYYNIQHRKFRLKVLHPKKKIQMEGKIESSRNSRNGILELIMDDKEMYYIKGMTDLQTVAGELRYTAMAELKLSKHGSPIILSGNVTKQHGKKMTFAFSLNNLLKDTAFITALIEKKADDKLKQYSLESEAYIPGVFGSYAIGLLQQRRNIWSNALRLKYGLLGDAKNLRHECDTGQKLKIDSDADEQYKFDIEHEFQCTQIQAFNHKLHLHHEEYDPHIHSYLEVSYGKHWDEMNNKKKFFISQTFKNNSNPSTASYFMEFTLQVTEKQVNYRTQLLHTHSGVESNTNFKMQYNDKMPFVFGLQWKNASKNDLHKWEGAFTMDTPWLYLYSALKLLQPQRSAYQATMEVSAGKALSVRSLVLDGFYKDTGNEKEGRIHIHTPTVTYLRASSVNLFGGNFFRSYSEMVSLWNQLIKNEIHLESSDKRKVFTFKLKSSRHEFNITADYGVVALPRKSSFLIKTMWVDQTSPPLVIQLDGQIEDLKKEVMFYQKRGSVHLRHPFKLPFPQSIHLQETFTVDKRKRHYMLETKLILDHTNQCIQTIVLGYHPDNPYICAGLKHPFKHRLVPSDTEACASTKRHLSGKHEVEATIKANKRDIFGLTGKFENKSNKKELWQAIRMEMTHSFQLRFPRSLSFNGEIFSRENRQDGFDYGARGKVVINTNLTLQLHGQFNHSLNQMGFYSHFTHACQWRIPRDLKVHASGKRYGGNNLNGTFIIQRGGKDVALIEVDINSEKRKNIRHMGLSISMQQILIANLEAARLKVMGKVFPSRVSLTSQIRLNNKSLLIDLLGSKEEKVGFVLSFTGNLEHNIALLSTIPQHLLIDGSVKQKNNINECHIRFIKNLAFYQLQLRNRNIYSNGSLHNISFIFNQNGSHLLPLESKLTANVQLQEQNRTGQVCVQVDKKLLCVELLNFADKEHCVKGILSHNIVTLQNAGIPIKSAVEITYNNTGNNKVCGITLNSGSSSINMSLGMERSSFYSQIKTSMKHNMESLKYHKIPYMILSTGYYQSLNKKILTGANISVEDQHMKVQLQKKSTGSASDISLTLQHDLSSINTVIPSSIKVICNGEFTSSLFYGHCHGELSRKDLEISAPEKIVVNGSLLTTGLKTNIFGLASSGDAFVRLNVNTEWGLQNTVEIGLKHALPRLLSMGIAKDNKIRIAAIRQGKNSALLDLAFGKCLLKANCEAKTDEGFNSSTLNWTSSLLTSCNLLEKLHFPRNLVMNGSMQRSHCDTGLSLRVDYEGKDFKALLRTICNPYTVQGTLNHSIPYLINLGLPSENYIALSSNTGPSAGGMVSFRSGTCKIIAKANIRSNNKTEWMLQTESDCKLLKDLSIPSQAQMNGSAMINGCEAELHCALTLDGNTSKFQVKTECQPKIKVEFIFRHNLPMLKEINEESKMTITVGKHANYFTNILLKSGMCAIDVKGDLNADNKLQWKMVVENKCKTIQDLGAPMKIEGSGYIVINKKANLDSQMLVVVDESTLQGLLILKATEKKQELDAVITHNVQPAINLGIPIRTMVDIKTERSNDLYRRSIQLSLDSKQISEEMSFSQKDDYTSFNYKITHNLEALKKLLLENNMEIRTLVEQDESKNMSIAAYYGPSFLNATVRVNGNETKTNLTTSVHHNWACLLRNGISPFVQTSLDIHAVNGRQEISLEAASTQKIFVCKLSSLSTAKRNELHLKSTHNIESILKYGYPGIIFVAGTLAKEGNKTNYILDLELDKKKISVDFKSFAETGNTFAIAAGVKHSFPMLLAWSVPNSSQMFLQAISTNTDIGGSFKLNCEQRTNISITANVKSQQQSDEVIVKATHSIAALRPYIPASSTLITGDMQYKCVNAANSMTNRHDKAEIMVYSPKDIEVKLFLIVEEKEFNLSAKINYTDNLYLKTIQLKHSIPQLKSLPTTLEIWTVYERRHKTFALRHITVWGKKELKLSGFYTGLFPKLSGRHEISGEFSQSLLLSAMQKANISIYIDHSTHSHQDHITIGWNNKNQVKLSSLLKMGRERMECRATISHPFSLVLREMELNSLSTWKGSQYSQQTHIGWNKGLPVKFTITLEDKFSNVTRVWNACVTVLPGQIKHLLSFGNLQTCGYMEKLSNSFHENVVVNWDNKRFTQNLLYKSDNLSSLDSLQLETTFQNIFGTGCSSHHILTKIDTNYMDSMSHVLKMDFCDLPHPIVFSGNHYLNKEEFLNSKLQLSTSPYIKDDTVFALALSDYGVQPAQNYSLSLSFKATDDIQFGVLGKYVSSSDRKQIQLEGRIDNKDTWTLGASSMQRCLQLHFGQYLEGNSAEKGVEVRACIDPKHLASVDTYMHFNRTLEKLGHFVLSTTNQSLSLSYQGCGENVAKAENILGSLASSLKTRLVDINRKVEIYIQKILNTVQGYQFLHESFKWPLSVSHDIAEILQYGPKAVHQTWKQSGLRQTLRHDLPLYLEKLNNLVQQMQTELQKPMSTLKGAYYDATLESLDEVWYEKTEACLHHIEAYLPSVVKEDWLMEPIRHILHGIKAAVDTGINQLLKWTENKLSKAVSRIRKPLTGMFHYCSNCSLSVNFPVLPVEYHLTDLANVTHYIIEKKLMKPLKDLYSVNVIAEYYRFKRRMMESPFESHAVLIGNKHIVTFDGDIIDLYSKCSLLLAKDFEHNTFTIILNQGTDEHRAVHVEMNKVALDIYPGIKVEQNCQSIDFPTVKNGISIRKNSNTVEVSNQEGTTVQCYIHHKVCSITLEGWRHGISAGLFGTNDNEARNELLLPDQSIANNTHDFSIKWQVDSQCSFGRKKAKSCLSAPHQKLCKSFFQGSSSVLRNCFSVIHPAPFLSMCVEDICDSNEIRPVCDLAAAYVHLCNRNFVPIDIPSQCGLLEEDPILPISEEILAGSTPIVPAEEFCSGSLQLHVWFLLLKCCKSSVYRLLKGYREGLSQSLQID
ncbi:uncharacterized protein PAF06_014108 [Gastrophryne carolinensis]